MQSSDSSLLQRWQEWRARRLLRKSALILDTAQQRAAAMVTRALRIAPWLKPQGRADERNNGETEK